MDTLDPKGSDFRFKFASAVKLHLEDAPIYIDSEYFSELVV